jgi:hypothetical protein
LEKNGRAGHKEKNEQVRFNIMKPSTLFASVAFATVTLTAATQAATTNVLEKISLQLIVQSQGPSTTNRDGTVTERIVSSGLTSAGLIEALGKDTNITTGAFSNGAYLAFDTVVTNGTNLPPMIVVVEGSGTNQTLTPVGADIKLGARGVVLRDGSFKTNGLESATTYRIRTLDISITNQWDLNLRGLAVRNVLDVTQGSGPSGIHVDAGDLFLPLSGYGKEGGGTNSTSVIVTGSLSAGFSKVLTTPSSSDLAD